MTNPPRLARGRRVVFLAVLASFVASLAVGARPQNSAAVAAVPGAEWMRLASPEQSGWSTKKLAEIGDYIEQIGSTSVMIVQHGVVVAAWGDIKQKSNLHSCRKSLLDALIGIAVADGKISLDDTLEKLEIDDKKPSLTAEEKQATVRELLEARSGVYHEAAYETPGMQEKRPARGSHPHGSYWYYNNWDFNSLGHIYETATGSKIFEAFGREIGQPIGMQDFNARDGHYVSSGESKYPAYVFDMSARDFARFALLYLHGGRWGDKQIVPADWVKASTHPYSDNVSGGYGYLWWTGDSTTGVAGETAFPKGSFWAEGNLGQYAVVVPSLDLIVVNRVDDKLTRHAVKKREIAQLVKMVVAAAP
jgi:CubicO group peptidase (beta-lactamase class C family)